MEFVKWMALNWYFVVIAAGVLVWFLVSGRQSLQRHGELRHERRIAEIKARASVLPLGHSLSEAEKTIELNRSVEIMQDFFNEANNNALVAVALESQLKDAQKFIRDINNTAKEIG